MLRIKVAIKKLAAFIYNLLYFANRSQEENDIALLRNLVLSLPEGIKSKYSEECAYLEKLPLKDLRLMMFPYPVDKGMCNGVDGVLFAKEKGLFYALHKERFKLFFPKGSNGIEYLWLVNYEGLLGNGRLVKSPHCYQDGSFKVEDGDILLDVERRQANVSAVRIPSERIRGCRSR